MEKSYQVRYCDRNSILVINPTGNLRRVYTPFRVVSDMADGKRRWFIVDEVYTAEDGGLIYMINRQPHPYHQFHIEIHF